MAAERPARNLAHQDLAASRLSNTRSSLSLKARKLSRCLLISSMDPVLVDLLLAGPGPRVWRLERWKPSRHGSGGDQSSLGSSPSPAGLAMGSARLA